MFARALSLASQFTRPVVVGYRFFDESVAADLGACIVVNRDGWIVTAAHLLTASSVAQQHAAEIAAYQTARRQSQVKPRRVGFFRSPPPELPAPNPRWLTNYAIACGAAELRDPMIWPEADLAIGRLEPFDPASVAHYPTFKNPSQPMPHGASLCKLGYPFNTVQPTFDSTTPAFHFGEVNLAMFPLDGIYTREVLDPQAISGSSPLRFIETSTPGLRGQSGGPVFDVNGVVWGMQSRTVSLALGFNPRLAVGDDIVEENQFLNVGWALHVDVILQTLRQRGIAVSVSDH